MASPLLPQLVIRSWMRDENTPKRPFGSAQTRQQYVELAASQSDLPFGQADMLPLGAANPGVDRRVDAIPHWLKDDDDEPPELHSVRDTEDDLEFGEVAVQQRASDAVTEQRKLRKAGFAVELYLSLMARTTSAHVLPFLLICMSLLALKSGMASDCWETFQFMLVLVSKGWITQFARDVAAQLLYNMLHDEDVSWNVRFVVGDNCPSVPYSSGAQPQQYTHTEHTRTTRHFLQFIMRCFGPRLSSVSQTPPWQTWARGQQDSTRSRRSVRS